MANNILSVIWITDQHWSYYYLLIGFLLLIICFLLYRLRQLKKNIGKEQDYYHSLFDILDNLPFPIMVKDIQNSFRYYYWNKESELQSGIKREEAIGCTDYEIYGEERGRKYRDVDESLVQADKIYRAEESYSTVDGAVHDTIAVKSIIKWKEKKKWLLVTRWDITRLKTYERELIAAKEELEKALNKQKLALKSVNFGLIYIDKNYLVQWEETTQIASLVKGRHYTPGQICYKTSALRDTPCEQCAFQKAIEQGKIIRHTIQIDQVDFEVTATPVYDNEGIEIIGGLLRFEDITEKVKMDKMLQEAKEKAEESNRLKSAFLANMSHEIRTPLNAIVGFSGILASTEEEEEKQEYVSIIENNNTLLLQLISDILDLSKIEAGTLDLHYSNVEINDLMKDLENMCQLKLKSDAVKLEFVAPEEPCFAHIEKNRLSQLIINLVTNAIKFTIQGSIRFGYKRQNNELYFYVADTGCGIPQDKQKSIFGRFVKLNSFAQGTGLGLSICQTLVEHMGGKIGVESEEGNGSTFWFTLPYKQAETVKKSLPKDIQPIAIEKDKLVILIAEDNESNYKLFESILKYDYHLLHAWDGQEAVNMFKEHNPQIILMDINMPVLDGYEATKEIRKYSAKVPIIAITAFAYASDEQRVMESGLDGYMPKPINARQLKAQLTDIMQKRIVLL